MNERCDAMYRSNKCIITPQRKITWYEKRTNLEKQFLIILAITFFILVVLVTFLFSLYLRYGFAFRYIKPFATVLHDFNKLDKEAILSKINGESNVCMTEHCVLVSSQLLEGMNRSVDPCDDFHEFVCGNWIKKHTIPGNRGSVSNFDKLTTDMSSEIKRIIDDLPKLTDNRMYRNSYDFWTICNNESRLEIEKDDELRNFIENKLGGWPLARSTAANETRTEFDLIDIHSKINEQGYATDGFVQITTTLDVLRNISQYTIFIYPPAVSLHHNYLIRNSTDFRIQAYFNLILDAVQTYNPDLEIDDKQIWNLIDFERKLSSLSQYHDKDIKSTKNLHKGKVSDLYTISPTFPWNTFLKFNYDHEIPYTQNIIYADHKYLSEFHQFINSTEPTVLKNYLIWKLVRSSMALMDSRWLKIIQTFHKRNFGYSTLQQQNRTQLCNTLIYSTFSHLIDHLYVLNKPEIKKKQQVAEIADAVHKQFLKILSDVDWFGDDQTRSKAISKASKTSIQIGYPDELTDASLISDFYSKINIEPESSLYRNMLLISRWIKQSSYQLLNTTNARNDWKLFGSILVVNGFYSRYRNTVILPIGLLGRHIFNENNPYYMNFATIGFIISHELTHGFDEEGFKIDENGHLNVWKSSTKKLFQKKVDCIIDSYSNYKVNNNLRIRAKETLNENLADIGGVKTAFLAYRNYLKEKGIKNEYRLPGLHEFNNEQLFWISYANTWCRKSTQKQTIVNVELDNHSLAKYRYDFYPVFL